MATYDSKSTILQKFGVPTTKRELGGYEEWIYDFGNVTYSNQRTSYQPSYFGRTNARTRGTQETYNKFVKFTFADSSDQVLKWESQGVNYEVKVRDKKKTIILCAAILITVIIADTTN